jgi:hypothetical protein
MSQEGEDIHKKPARDSRLKEAQNKSFSVVNKSFVLPDVVEAIRNTHDLRSE